MAIPFYMQKELVVAIKFYKNHDDNQTSKFEGDYNCIKIIIIKIILLLANNYNMANHSKRRMTLYVKE